MGLLDDLILVKHIDDEVDQAVGALLAQDVKYLSRYQHTYYAPEERYNLYEEHVIFTECPIEDLPLFISYPYTSPLYRQMLGTL
ncbi:MAG: hypothetical protein GF334_05435 [Candidatus Altiarchaeales archaeon]|nr:hypothetical protein [Candidatus Altiarchaeales archaeon]